MSQSLPKLYVNSKRTEYIGISVICVLAFVNEMYSKNRTFYSALTSTIGGVVLLVFVFSLYKIFFGRHKIIFQETEFKIQGYDWVGWNELVGVYPFDELDSENGTRSFIRFRLIDGTDLSVRSENLELSFEQLSNLVDKYRMNFQNIQNN